MFCGKTVIRNYSIKQSEKKKEEKKVVFLDNLKSIYYIVLKMILKYHNDTFIYLDPYEQQYGFFGNEMLDSNINKFI